MTGDAPLEHLVGAYLNQDVWDFYPNVMAGVDDFLRDEPDLALPLALEIDALLAADPSEGELTDLMRRLGAGFLPDDHGYRGWLTQIADRVRQATSQR
jgi:hypothetical protein